MHKINSYLISFIFFIGLNLNTTSGQKDWELVSNLDEIGLWTKDNPGTKIKQFKLKTKVKSDIQSAYQLLRDIENMSTWYDRIKSVKLLKSINANEGIYLLEYSLPFPFDNRITTVKGNIDFPPSKNKLTVSTSYFEYAIPKEKSDLVKITQIWSAWEIISLNQNEIEVTHMGSMDPSGNIPQWLVNDGIHSGPIKTIKAFKAQLKKY